MERIRILHVVTYMGRGGLETMLMNYYRHIDRDLMQFDFLVHRDFEADYDREIMELGGRIYRLPKLNPFDQKYKKALNSFFKEHHEYQIVHSHIDCMSALPLCAAKENGVKLCIAHSHNNNQTKDFKYPLKLFYKRYIPKYADILFACGKSAGKWMFNGKEFYILNNAIDVKKYAFNNDIRSKIRAELNISDDNIVIGHVGRFAKQKNHRFIIAVFNEVCKRQDNYKLLLVGNGELMDEIKHLVTHYGLDSKVIYAGVRTDVFELLQAMDIFFFPSLNEGLPLSIIEAQAAGLPCIISTSVPEDCVKTDLVYRQSLDVSADGWAEMILSFSRNIRVDTSNIIIDKGFDIISNARKLEQFYKACYENSDLKTINRITERLFELNT